MEKILKIIIIVLICTILSVYQFWTIAVLFSVTCLAISAFRPMRFLVCIMPIVGLLLAYVVHDSLLFTVWIVVLYAARVYIREKSLQNLQYGVFVVLLIIATHVYLPQATIICIILAIFAIPIPLLSQYDLPKYGLTVVCVSVIFMWAALSAFTLSQNHKKRCCAYMNHGVWCKASPDYSADSLSNSCAYSYSELCNMLDADTISSVISLNKYNELWIMTPTKPFTNLEIDLIRKWVLKGGHLIVGTDHTDLYGHARVANTLLQTFGCSVSYASVFETNKSSYFANSNGRLCPLKTPNSVDKMTFGFPLLSILAWKEKAYYGNDNFFGPMSANANNDFNVHDIVSTRIYGLGRITIVADTTFCANFAIYQPYVREFIDFLLSYHSESLVVLILSILLIILFLIKDKCHLLLVSISFAIVPVLISIFSQRILEREVNTQIWTGDRTFLSENICPFACISTAYSLSALSGRHPYWQDKVDVSEDDVIWVDSVPPKNPKWRWIHVNDNHNHFYTNGEYSPEFMPLYDNLGAVEVRSYTSAFKSYNELNVECIFNDAVLNDWWYGNFGLSETRKRRINAWLKWLNKERFESEPFIFDRNFFTKDVYPAILHIKDKSPIEVYLPKPQIAYTEEVNFGCGIVGKDVSQSQDSVKIIGLHEFSENWDCPPLWTLTYK